DAEHVEREIEEAIELLLGALALEHLADLDADARQHLEQPSVRLADLAREELEHAEHAAAEQNRDGERAVQPLALCDHRTRKVRVLNDVLDPGGPAGLPDPARQPDAGREGGLARDGLEPLEMRRRRLPGLDAPQDVGGPVDAPEAAVVPAETGANRLQDAGRGFGDGRRIREGS